MSKSNDDDVKSTKRLMDALLRQPPKLHEDMKVGRKRSTTPADTQNPKRKAPGTSPGAKR